MNMCQIVRPERMEDLTSPVLAEGSADTSTTRNDHLSPQPAASPTSVSPSVTSPLRVHTDMLTGPLPSSISCEQLPTQTDKALLKFHDRYDSHKFSSDILQETTASTSSLSEDCIAGKRSLGMFLKPLSFPEPPHNVLSCFLGPEMDLPISCLLCSETFGSLPSQRSSTVKKEQLLGKVGALYKGDFNLPSSSKEGSLHDPPNICGAESSPHDVDGYPPEESSCDPINTTTRYSSSTCLESSQSKLLLEGKPANQDFKPSNQDSKPPCLIKLAPKDVWLQHLLKEHNIVINNVTNICSLKW